MQRQAASGSGDGSAVSGILAGPLAKSPKSERFRPETADIWLLHSWAAFGIRLPTGGYRLPDISDAGVAQG